MTLSSLADLLTERVRPLLIGVVHLEPLPGAPRCDGSDRARHSLLERAREDAQAWCRGGADGCCGRDGDLRLAQDGL